MTKIGFTLLELVIVVAIFSILLAIGIPSIHFFQRESSLGDAAEEVKNVLSLAQSKAISSEGAKPHGVFFDNTSSPHQYLLFRGSSFASRDLSFDQTYQLPKTIEFSQINFGGNSELVFQRITGEVDQSGFVTIRLKAQPANTRTVSADVSGTAFVGTLVAPADTDRIKDSRHVHLDYSRVIDAPTENIVLTFTGNSGQVQQTIKIADYVQAGDIVWSGSVTVDGEGQQLEIRTHSFNNPQTQFSITRDRRKNTKALQVSLSGDGTGDFIIYDTSGNTTKTSSYAGQSVWQ